MKHLKPLLLLVLALSVSTFVSCEEDEEALLPALSHITAEDFSVMVEGKGWRYVESHEIRGNRVYSKRDYWDGLIGGGPMNYAFSGDSITEFIYIDAYPIKGYKSKKYTFDETTNCLMSDGDEMMRVVSVSESELRIIKHEASTADGEPIYVYAVYRAMSPSEFISYKENYRYNLDSLDEEYPRLPEQQRLTAADFTALAVGQGWKCAEAHVMELGNRYAVGEFYSSGTRLKPVDYYISEDSLTVFSAGVNNGGTAMRSVAYNYRANGFYLETADKSGFRIVSLSAEEMRVVSRRYDGSVNRDVRLYCVYRRMTADELAQKLTGGSMRTTLLAEKDF